MVLRRHVGIFKNEYIYIYNVIFGFFFWSYTKYTYTPTHEITTIHRYAVSGVYTTTTYNIE